MGKQRKPENDVPEQERLAHLKKRYEHDAFCKDNLRDPETARKFLPLMLEPRVVDWLDLDCLEVSPESFLTEDLKKLYGDVLYKIPVKDSDETITVFVLIELKTVSDRWTVFQQAKYIIRIWDQEYRQAEKEGRLDGFKLPTVIPIIFHHGEYRFSASTELIDQVRVLEGLERYTLNMRSFLFDIVSLGDEGLPEDLELCALIMVLQAVFKKDIADRLMAIYCKLRPKLYEPRYMKLWLDCLYYATTSAKNFKKDDRLKIMDKIINMGDTVMSTTLWDQLIEEGEAKGKAETIVGFLKARFGKVRKSTSDAIHSITDLKTLEKLTELAARCESLDEFEKALP